MFGNVYDTKIWRWEFLIMIFVLITCDTGRCCIQLMILSLPRAPENVVDRHRWVESLNDDDEVAVNIHILLKKHESVSVHAPPPLFSLVTIC
jgi:hypothetical protein